MNCLIVDDNKMARMAMQQLVSQVKDLAIMAECESAVEAYQLIREKKPDLLLLDIEMPGMTGLELTRNLGEEGPLIIFTTGKEQYAVEAFSLNVVDYLVKPVQPARFLQAIDKVREILSTDQKGEGSPKEIRFVFVKEAGILRRLPVEEILYAEAMGDYVKVFTTQKFYTVHSTLRSIEERLPPSLFMRVHRSYLIALDRIDFIEEGVINIGKKSIPVADAYRSAFNKRLNLL